MPRPVIKWVGGKTQLLSEILKRIPSPLPDTATYYEPFIGGGAVFWAVRNHFSKCVINDFNLELVTVYQVIQDFPDDLMNRLRDMPYGREEFERVRALDPADLCAVRRAARMIYLNKCGFNGLYRVNKAGKFNVPFGSHKKPPALFDEDNIRECSEALKGVDINCGDFEDTVKNAKAGDYVYFDPPYVPLNPTSDFTKYTADGFGMKQQERLADCVKRLNSLGVNVLLSNSYTPTVLELYKDFTVTEVKARRSVNSKGDGRGKISEALVTNYDTTKFDDCLLYGDSCASS